jgi:outer membrane immunogenic protein
MISKILPVALAIVAFDVAGASAADMPVKAPPKTVAAPFNWTGCYIGGHFGGTWGRKDISSSNLSLVADDNPSFSTDTGGFLPGGQIGCNYQGAGNWVVGVEGSVSTFTLKGETQFVDGSDFTVKGNWLASATGTPKAASPGFGKSTNWSVRTPRPIFARTIRAPGGRSDSA